MFPRFRLVGANKSLDGGAILFRCLFIKAVLPHNEIVDAAWRFVTVSLGISNDPEK